MQKDLAAKGRTLCLENTPAGIAERLLGPRL
jgi:hypothetical protein